jgi:hypothetical protein
MSRGRCFQARERAGISEFSDSQKREKLSVRGFIDRLRKTRSDIEGAYSVGRL